jgi:RHS repeat-associated protein
VTTNSTFSETLQYTNWLALTSDTGPSGATASMTYDIYGRPQTATSVHGAQTTYSYDLAARIITATTNNKWVKKHLDGLGRVTRLETGNSTEGTKSIVDTEYDSCACSPIGKVKRVSQPHTGTATAWTVYQYDAMGRTIRIDHPGNSGATRYEYAGNRTTVIDPSGRQKTFENDVFGNLVKVTEPAPASAGTTIRVNNGGGAVTDPRGYVWSADTGCSSGYPFGTGAAISGTDTPQLYQVERYNIPSFTCTYAVTNGTYSVTLKFAEISIETTGQRLFHVDLNGTRVLSSFDVYATAGGPNKAVDRTFPVTVTGGQVSLTFTAVASSATVSAIEILPTGGSGGAPHETFYTYDRFNRLTNVSMPRGGVTQTRTWEYRTSDQRLWKVTNPENGTTEFQYNTDGTVQWKKDAKGNRIEYSYDAHQRVTQIRRYPLGGSEDQGQRVDLSYDTNPYDGSFTQYGFSRPTAARWVGGGYTWTEMYSYTQAGLMTRKRLSPSGFVTPLDTAQTYDNEGKMTSVSYPGGPTYTYSFDAMGRPNGMTDDSAVTWVQGVSYGAANQITSMQYRSDSPYFWTETRTYDERLQMTRLTTKNHLLAAQNDVEYRYSPSANNGRVIQMKDWVTGEEVNYQYDSLQRLIKSETTGPEWGLSFAFDGFGNRTSQSVTKGSGPTSSLSFNGLTNRITTAGFGYDANGNLTAMPGVTGLTYDVENRLLTANGETYSYGPDNKRVWLRKSSGEEYVYFYGIGGRRMGVYRKVSSSLALQREEVYFAGKRIRSGAQAVAEDRLGSTRKEGTTASRFYPYGEESGTTAEDRTKFATYYRDAGTGLDYADQRYYDRLSGRFLTADPYMASGGPADPGSWNRYGYVQGDPVNSFDPGGLVVAPASRDFIEQCVGRIPAWFSGSPAQLPPGCHQFLEPGAGSSSGPARGDLRDKAAARQDCLAEAGVNMSDAQKQMLGDFEWWKMTPFEQAAFLNFTATAAATGVDLSGFTVSSLAQDRVVLGVAPGADTEEFLGALQGNANFVSSKTDPMVGPVHAGYTHNFRQAVARYSMQINVSATSVEIDIDLYNPAMGLAPLVGHGAEVLTNSVFNARTNPYQVGAGLRERGVNLGHNCR